MLWNETRLHAADADPRVRGPFPILSTPFTESGAVDYEVLTRLWQLMDSGKDADTVRDIHAKLLLLFNLGQHLPGGDLRGFQLHLWKKRGVFKNMISRQYGPGRSIPDKPIFAELALTADEIAEIDFRFEALRPYFKPNPPRFAAATQ